MPIDALSFIADSLQELYITHNLQPLTLPTGIFRGLKLKKLVLSNSGLEDEDFLQGLTVEEISLNENPLEEFDCQECPLLKDTKRIFLSKTKLSKITKENFITMTGLEELDLDGNDLMVFNATVFEHMTNLADLDLSENEIEDWDGNYSSSLPQLKSLFLHGNNIETLPSGLEPLFSHIKNLTLHENPLHCNCEVHWFAKWMEKEDHRHRTHPETKGEVEVGLAVAVAVVAIVAAAAAEAALEAAGFRFQPVGVHQVRDRGCGGRGVGRSWGGPPRS